MLVLVLLDDKTSTEAKAVGLFVGNISTTGHAVIIAVS